MRKRFIRFGDEFYICGEWRHSPHPTAGEEPSPDPWNELQCVFAGYVTARLGTVGREFLKSISQMEKCISI
jgi:hypothetical protein